MSNSHFALADSPRAYRSFSGQLFGGALVAATSTLAVSAQTPALQADRTQSTINGFRNWMPCEVGDWTGSEAQAFSSEGKSSPLAWDCGNAGQWVSQ
jgi:hypothetical protein